MNLISILYIKTSSHTDEKISIGLFASSSEKKYFSYSGDKIKIANSIIDTNIAPSIGYTLKNIKREVDAYNNSPLKFNDFGLNESSFNYLNTYSKGILSFEKLKPVGIEINDSSFESLFSLLIDSAVAKENVVSFTKRFNSKLKHKAFNKINKKYEIAPSILGTYASHKVDFIGKNGSLLVGTSIDFNSRPETIDRGILEFNAITEALISFSRAHNLPEGNYNIYCNEPEESEGKAFFDKVYFDTDKIFNLLTIDKVDEVITQLEGGNYIKFSEYLDSIN
ncbi:MAG: hypothetical protein RLZZ357_1134 [Bacteroidota bacterium]|jgi:hypothetical protein